MLVWTLRKTSLFLSSQQPEVAFFGTWSLRTESWYCQSVGLGQPVQTVDFASNLGFPLRRKVATSLLGAREAPWMVAAWWKMLFWKKKSIEKKNSTIFFRRKSKSKFYFLGFFKFLAKNIENPKFSIFGWNFRNFDFFEKKSRKNVFFSKTFFQLFSKSFQYFLMNFFSGFSFRQAAPVQGACGGRAPRSPPGSLSGVRRRVARRLRNATNRRIPSKIEVNLSKIQVSISKIPQISKPYQYFAGRSYET